MLACSRRPRPSNVAHRVLVVMSCLRLGETSPSPSNLYSPFLLRSQSGKFGGASSEAQEKQPQGIQTAAEAAEHENMKAVLRSGLREGESATSAVPGLRTRTRAANARGPPPPLEHLEQLSLSEKVSSSNSVFDLSL